MTSFPEDRVYARHKRRAGAVLIVGAGAVGGFLAEELARLGISPIRLVDPDTVAVENIVRHPLGAQAVGRPKASTLATQIKNSFPLCDVVGIDADFLQLSRELQLTLVKEADVVVAATDQAECQHRVNRICFEAEVPSVYPGVWVAPGLHDAEVGEVLWVLPRNTPCYACWSKFRETSMDAQAGRGARVDIQQVVLVATRVVEALLDLIDDSKELDPRTRILDRERTCIYIHGFTPTSPPVRNAFNTEGLRSRNVRVPLPETACNVCGLQQTRFMKERQLRVLAQLEQSLTNQLARAYRPDQEIKIIEATARQAIEEGLMERLSDEERRRIERQTHQRHWVWRALLTSGGEDGSGALRLVERLNRLRQRVTDTSELGELTARFETAMREYANDPVHRMVELRRIAQQALEAGLMNPSLQSVQEWNQFGGPLTFALRDTQRQVQDGS